MNNKYIMYLRKSRADEELEKQDEFETLNKHKSLLFSYAKEHDITIVKVYEEIVSGESIIHRPEMIKLLADIETKQYTGVLCMDLDRLGRGGMQDQGLILETFKQANAKILTPRKLYDLHNEFDEEYSEFEAFMARKELKIITRRLRNGIISSVKSGNYISSTPPFGYQIKNIKNGRTLEPDPDQVEYLKMIFDMYVNGININKIIEKLNKMNIKTYKNRSWCKSTVKYILRNHVYIGNITWGKCMHKKSKSADKKYLKKRQKEYTIVKGKHEAIITEDIFNLAQKRIKEDYRPPVSFGKLVNPLAGLIICGVCNNIMSHRGYQNDVDPYIICRQKCGNISSKFKYIENKLIDEIEKHLREYKLKKPELKKTNIKYKKMIDKLNIEINNIKTQKSRLHDLLEQGVYDSETFLNRQNVLSSRHDEIIAQIQDIKDREQHKILLENNVEFLNTITGVMDVYRIITSIEDKNKILKTILDKVIYVRKNRQNEFTLELHFKIKS